MHGESTNCLFSIQIFIDFDSLRELTKMENQYARNVDKMNAGIKKKDTDTFSFHFINVVTNYIHIKFEQSSFISTEIIDSMLKDLFFLLFSRS